MLHILSVKNFILIDELELEFKAGFAAITGESGSGKSMLINAILFALGKEINNKNIHIVKVGAESCVVSAVFTANNETKNLLDDLQIECEDELLIKRIQTAAGKTKYYINDQIVTAKTLAQITDSLFELHGQHHHTNLLDSTTHLQIIDLYGELVNVRNEVEKKYRQWQNIVKEIAEIAKDKAHIEREIDYLIFVEKELGEAKVEEGEELSLYSSRSKLQNRDRELKIYQGLSDELSIPEIDQALNAASKTVARSEKDYPILADLTRFIDNIYNNLEEARSLMKQVMYKFHEEPGDLTEIEDRLYRIRSLARKYNVSADNLAEFYQNSMTKLAELQGKILNASKLENNLLAAKDDYFVAATTLSHKRSKIVEKFEQKVASELKFLKMEKAEFKVEISAKNVEKAGSSGIDQVRFVASTNPGTPAGPIDKIASGGELSRFMLSMRVALFDKATKPTIIFDEIDKGVGGMVADSIGDRLKTLSKAVQVIVITHQPQVAGKADQHILVHKNQLTHTTKTQISILSEEQRIYELARMISGKSITEKGLHAARELLSQE